MKLLTILSVILFFHTTYYSQQIQFTATDSLNFEYRSVLFEHYQTINFEKSANNNCASATVLTPGAACLSSNTVGDNTQAGEIAPPCSAFGGGGVTDRTNWFRFTATSTQMVLDYMRTLQTNCGTSLAVYGPFSPGTGCLPTAAQSVYCENNIAAGDPGDHNLLTGLVTGQDYLIQILNKDCGGGNSREAYFCIGVSVPASNNDPSSASLINACGTAFNGSNTQGYYPSGSGTGLANLDGNAGTTCSGCVAGNDVPYVVNNDSWFNFCSANAGQWQVSFDVGACAQSNGLQMSIFTGTSGNLTNFQNAPSPSLTGSNFTSSTINLSAGECAYLVVDGFAGDQCSYSYTLTNLSGGCILLPVELLSFNIQRFEEQAYLKWVVETERNNDYFLIERSVDGIEWETVKQISSIGDHTYQYTYSLLDNIKEINQSEVLYYKLSQTDYNGSSEVVAIKTIRGQMKSDEEIAIQVIPNPVTESMINISVESLFDTFGNFLIMDATGTEIYSKNASLVRGANIVQMKPEHIVPGMYYVQFVYQGGTVIHKFLVL